MGGVECDTQMEGQAYNKIDVLLECECVFKVRTVQLECEYVYNIHTGYYKNTQTAHKTSPDEGLQSLLALSRFSLC